MPELRALLKKNDLVLRARSLFVRRPRSEGIIRFNAPFHCFRTSRSFLWPLKWSSRLLFVIMTSCSMSVTCPSIYCKIITYSKQWKGPSIINYDVIPCICNYSSTPSAAYRCRTNFWLYRDICALRDNAVKKSVNDADHCIEVYSWCWTVIEQYYCTITKNKEELIYSVDKCRKVFLCFLIVAWQY